MLKNRPQKNKQCSKCFSIWFRLFLLLACVSTQTLQVHPAKQDNTAGSHYHEFTNWGNGVTNFSRIFTTLSGQENGHFRPHVYH